MILRPNEIIDSQYPLRQLDIKSGLITYRESGIENKVVVVLLHGIGSASGSWYGQLKNLSLNYHVIAWDAPGYGDSTVISNDKPKARDYAQVLKQFVDRLKLQPVILVVIRLAH